MEITNSSVRFAPSAAGKITSMPVEQLGRWDGSKQHWNDRPDDIGYKKRCLHDILNSFTGDSIEAISTHSLMAHSEAGSPNVLCSLNHMFQLHVLAVEAHENAVINVLNWQIDVLKLCRFEQVTEFLRLSEEACV